MIIMPAEEEFHESDVIFAEDVHDDRYRYAAGCSDTHRIDIRNSSSSNEKGGGGGMKRSLPVDIPGGATVFRCSGGCGRDDEFDGAGEMEPPHVILGKRIGGEMAFSVCTGNGRTLKGRDLSRVRNSVLRMTGFLET